MGWRSKLEGGPPEHDPTPLYVASAALLLSIISYAIPNESVSGTLFGTGLISAGFCIVYWLANPARGDD
jgi:hypothetical protein